MAFVGSDGRLLRQDVYSVLFVFLFTKLLANSPGTTGQSVMSSSVPPPSWRFMGSSYKWAYKSANMGYNYKAVLLADMSSSLTRSSSLRLLSATKGATEPT